jgi:hypothetical protein
MFASVGLPTLAELQESAMINKQILAVAALLTLCSPAFAREPVMPDAVKKADFDVVKAHLIQQLDSDRYSEITPANKQAVLDALDRIDARLGKVEAPGQQLSDQDRVDLFNDQEIINTITSHAAADSRLYCERYSPTGSHRIKVLCMTLAVWKERERVGQDAMIAIDRHKNNNFPGGE